MTIHHARKLLKAAGWELVRRAGPHDIYVHPELGEKIALPRGQELRGYLRQVVLKGTRGSKAHGPVR
jgi:predicted RNA binding protein YcfA (HicA-like mRNA interferase family)